MDVRLHPRALPGPGKGQRTTPRTLAQFFSSIESIEHLRDRLGLVKMLGDGCLDDATVAAFIAFVHHQLDDLPHPEAVLGTKQFQADIVEKLEKLSGGDVRRVDILSILCTRLVHHAARRRLSDAEMDNLRSFILMKALPQDLRLAFAQDLASLDNESVQEALKEPEVALLILK